MSIARIDNIVRNSYGEYDRMCQQNVFFAKPSQYHYKEQTTQCVLKHHDRYFRQHACLLHLGTWKRQATQCLDNVAGRKHYQTDGNMGILVFVPWI